MDVDEALRLSELVCSRLCHDISGLLGTLEGTLQLLGEGDELRFEALIASVEGAKELNRRLQLLRAAWAESSALNSAQLDELASGLPGAHRLKLDLSGLPADAVFAPPLGRMVLNVLLLASQSLPRGGTIALAQEPGSADVLVRIDGPRARWPAGFATALVDEDAVRTALTEPQQLLPSMVALLSRSLGIRVTVLMPAGRTTRGPLPLVLSPAPAG